MAHVAMNALWTVFGAASVSFAILYIVFGSPWKCGGNRGIPGLRNLGNTCFINALLQALAACPLFVMWVNDCAQASKHSGNKTLLSVLSAALTMLSSEKVDADIIDPRPIIQALLDIGWTIPIAEEQDSHEFFHVLMSSLCDVDYQLQGLNGFPSACQQRNTELHKDSILHQRVHASSSSLSFGCPVVESHSPFYGTLASCLIHSTSLEKLPIKYDGFESISISMPRQREPKRGCFHNQSKSMPTLLSMRGVVTLEQCLLHYIKSESVEFRKSDELLSDSYQTTTYSKQLTFGKLPKCLAIHIQRTYWHDSGIPFKDNTYVQFPDVLDMSPYVHINTLFKRCYRLVSVICHVGDVFSGHFITYRHLNVNPSAMDHARLSQWVYTSDCTVRPASYQEVTSATAYMLFYEKLGIQPAHTSL